MPHPLQTATDKTAALKTFLFMVFFLPFSVYSTPAVLAAPHCDSSSFRLLLWRGHRIEAGNHVEQFRINPTLPQAMEGGMEIFQ